MAQCLELKFDEIFFSVQTGSERHSEKRLIAPRQFLSLSERDVGERWRRRDEVQQTS